MEKGRIENNNKYSISVVIPNYNGRQLLENNLPSVYKSLNKAGVEYEVIVADDCSSDDSVKFLEDNYPDILISKSNINKGFSPTINRGIFLASKDLVLTLNSDVVLEDDYFLPLFRYFSLENTFGVMGRIIDLTGDKIQDAAKYPDFSWGKIKSTVNFLPQSQPQDFMLPTVFLSGANALIDRKKLLELKGFDEIFRPFYLEDVDLSLRAWRLGWNCYYEHKAICRHPVSATIKNYHKLRNIRIVSKRNRFFIHAIHLSGVDKTLWSILIAFEFLFSWTFRLYFYKSFFQYIKKLSEVKKSRKNLKELLKNHKPNKSLYKVMDEVKKRIDVLPIQKF